MVGVAVRCRPRAAPSGRLIVTSRRERMGWYRACFLSRIRRSPNMLRHLLSIAGAMLLLPAAASAQGRFEITPTFSYNFGGTIDAEDSVLFDFDLEANDSEAF